ncbi:hypothetical protein GHT06_015212 [Daphnia sinensis]|uniref:RNA-directed DNA polymerase n=1 Tax=Daphnia sinensis TaxID=1820382 RepID=A0AAD5L9Z7_9CRUS|nr:hypothetical protein GHT06_015212 [Daphnia sinensis]
MSTYTGARSKTYSKLSEYTAHSESETPLLQQSIVNTDHVVPLVTPATSQCKRPTRSTHIKATVSNSPSILAETIDWIRRSPTPSDYYDTETGAAAAPYHSDVKASSNMIVDSANSKHASPSSNDQTIRDQHGHRRTFSREHSPIGTAINASRANQDTICRDYTPSSSRITIQPTEATRKTLISTPRKGFYQMSSGTAHHLPVIDRNFTPPSSSDDISISVGDSDWTTGRNHTTSRTSVSDIGDDELYTDSSGEEIPAHFDIDVNINTPGPTSDCESNGGTTPGKKLPNDIHQHPANSANTISHTKNGINCTHHRPTASSSGTSASNQNKYQPVKTSQKMNINQQSHQSNNLPMGDLQDYQKGQRALTMLLQIPNFSAYPKSEHENSIDAVRLQILRQKFLQGLDPALRNKIRYKPFTTYETMVADTNKYALRMENEKEEIHKRNLLMQSMAIVDHRKFKNYRSRYKSKMKKYVPSPRKRPIILVLTFTLKTGSQEYYEQPPNSLFRHRQERQSYDRPFQKNDRAPTTATCHFCGIKSHLMKDCRKFQPNLPGQYQENASDPLCISIRNYLDNGELTAENQEKFAIWVKEIDFYQVLNGVLYRKKHPIKSNKRQDVNYQVVLPLDLRPTELKHLHDDPTAGHLAYQRTYLKVKNHYYWLSMRKDIKEYCRVCKTCLANTKTTYRTFLHPHELAKTPFDVVGMDFLGPFNPPSTRNKKYIMVMTDYVTKWPEVVALPDQTALTTADAFLNLIIERHGLPKAIVSDRGSNFPSSVFRHLCKSLTIDQRLTTAYNPVSNGHTERFNRTLTTMLRKELGDGCHDNWENILGEVCFAYRTSIPSSTLESPFLMLYGRDANLPISNFREAMTAPTASPSDYVGSLLERLQMSFQRAREENKKPRERQREQYYKVGDKVLLDIKVLPHGETKSSSPSPESNHPLEKKGEESYDIDGSHSGDCLNTCGGKDFVIFRREKSLKNSQNYPPRRLKTISTGNGTSSIHPKATQPRTNQNRRHQQMRRYPAEGTAEGTPGNPYVKEEYYRKHRSLSIRAFRKHKAEFEEHLERKKKKLSPQESPYPDSYPLPNFSTHEGINWTELTAQPATNDFIRIQILPLEMILYVTITLLLSSTSAFQTFVCNCKNPIKTEHLRRQDDYCPAILDPAQKNVEYTLWTNRRSGIKFQGTICGRWTKINHITTDFFGQKIIVPETIALDTSVEDCNIMGKIKKCEDRQMHFVDGKWTLNTEPPTSGKANVSHGSHSHNHLTLIWDKALASALDNTPKRIDNGEGHLIKTSTPETYRLEDETKQLGFHIKRINRCLTAFCQNKNDSFIVNRRLTISDAVTQSSILGPQETGPLSSDNRSNSPLDHILRSQNKLAAHVQFVRDKVIEQENSMIRTIRNTQSTYRECYWREKYVNFHGKHHVYRNGTWTKAEATLIQPERDWPTTFRYDDDNTYEYEPQANPAYDNWAGSHMNIVADIAAAMSEQNVNENSGSYPIKTLILTPKEKADISNYVTWWETIKIILALTGLLIILALTFQLLHWFGIFELCWTGCCKPTHRTLQNIHRPQRRRREVMDISEPVDLRQFLPPLQTDV